MFTFIKYPTVLGVALLIAVGSVCLAEAPASTARHVAIELSGHIGQFDRSTYRIESDSSLFVEAQASSGIRKVTFHDQNEAIQLSENDAVSVDRGDHLRDLRSLEWIVTSPPQVSGSYRVAGGWPVDVTVENGKITQAVIHGPTNAYFAAQQYANVAGRTIIRSWMLDAEPYRFDTVRIVDEKNATQFQTYV